MASFIKLNNIKYKVSMPIIDQDFNTRPYNKLQN